MPDNNIEVSRLREINGGPKSGWVGMSTQVPPDLKSKLEEVAVENGVPLTAVVIHACERLLESVAA